MVFPNNPFHLFEPFELTVSQRLKVVTMRKELVIRYVPLV